MEAFEGFRAILNRGFNSQCDSLKAHLATLESEINDLRHKARQADDLERQNTYLRSKLQELSTPDSNAGTQLDGTWGTTCQPLAPSLQLGTLPQSLNRLVRESPELSRFLEQKASDYAKLRTSHSKLLKKAREYRGTLLTWQKRFHAAGSRTVNRANWRTRKSCDDNSRSNSEGLSASIRNSHVIIAGKSNGLNSAPLKWPFSEAFPRDRHDRTLAAYEAGNDFATGQPTTFHASRGPHQGAMLGWGSSAHAQQSVKMPAKPTLDEPILHSPIQNHAPGHKVPSSDLMNDGFQFPTSNETRCENHTRRFLHPEPGSGELDNDSMWSTNHPVKDGQDSLNLDATPRMTISELDQAKLHAMANAPSIR